jgi:hypothetical protein
MIDAVGTIDDYQIPVAKPFDNWWRNGPRGALDARRVLQSLVRQNPVQVRNPG